ncbi:MAG: carcinine hydrolase/isopenicillin-N N-acyltransferase family protein [Prevotellaceae bacterium]|nr:carcinine hydrolase/isopenicillin-N N-acyltransferase family protein [Prevotellaceae bacterium]MDY6131423.1 carcinine hydrolase/isopenicillin-N N-acyltransferase family protein [Prevotella sp.]
MMKRTILAVLAAVVSVGAFACTSVIVSGKITPDGRPLLLKNRDADDLDNLVAMLQGEKYKFIGIVATNDVKMENVWSGHNEKGFAIFNTDAFNLNGKEKPEQENDGKVMKRALGICATLKDFEHLLDTLSKPMYLNSNFGVMDAQGNCAYFETSSKGYTKYDVNDPKVAPYGYLVRTNHAMTGDRSLDQGIERYMAISDLMENAAFAGSVNRDLLLRQATRHLTNGMTKTNLYDDMPESGTVDKMYPYIDFISRYYTASADVIQGVKPGEDPLLTISWTIIGCPLTTVAVPLMITKSGKLPEVVVRNGDGFSELCHYGLEAKKQLYPMTRGNGLNYINLPKLVNKQGTGCVQRLQPIETEIIRRGEQAIDALRRDVNSPKAAKAMDDYYQWADSYIRTELMRK